MKPLELTCTLRNNCLKERRESAGLSRKGLCDLVGISQSEYGRLESLKMSPRRPRDSSWRLIAMRLAQYYKITEDDLFPSVVQAVKNPEVKRVLDEDEIGMLVADYEDRLLVPTPEEEVSRKEQCRLAVAIAHGVSNGKGELVVSERWGLDGNGERSQREIAEKLGLTHEAVSSIECRCIQKIRGDRRMRGG
jgi:transcriptional regulator with XRE-family HTH domain